MAWAIKTNMTAELTHRSRQHSLSMEECVEIRLFATLIDRKDSETSAGESLLLYDIAFQQLCAESVVSYLQQSRRLRKFGDKKLKIVKVPTDDASMYKIGLLSVESTGSANDDERVAFDFTGTAYDNTGQKEKFFEDAIMKSGIDTLITEGSYRPDVADKQRMQHIKEELAHIGIPTTLSPIYQRGRAEPVSYSLSRGESNSSNVIRLDDHR